MDAKIFAIKTKLQLMEKEDSSGGTGSINSRPGTSAPNKHRYEPYHKHKRY
jgi:hypothetical protein